MTDYRSHPVRGVYGRLHPNISLYHNADFGVIFDVANPDYLQFALISIGVLKSQRPIINHSVNFLGQLR